MRPLALAALSTLPCLALALPARADAPPKVCVVVAGDPDVSARESAERLADAIAARTDLRGVADAEIRAVLRGENRPDGSLAPLAASRRALRGTDSDASTLDAIGEPLGCALVVEVASRPTSMALRAYDVVHHAFRGAIQVGLVDASLIDRFVYDHARAALAPAAPPAVPAPTAPAAVTQQAAEPPSARATSIAPAGRAPLPSPQPRVLRTSGATATTTRAAPTREPRTNVPTERSEQGRQPGIVPWIVAGGAALAIIAVFFLAQGSGPGTTVITVAHPPGNGP